MVKLPTEATLTVGKLDGVGQPLSNPYPLVGSFLGRDAVALSRTEGTPTYLEQLLLFESLTSRPPSPATCKGSQTTLRHLRSDRHRHQSAPSRSVSSARCAIS